MSSLRAALRFLTRIPVPGPATVAGDLPGAVAWFPLVGALLGAALAGLFLGALAWWPPAVAAVLAIAGGLLLGGGFHEDAVGDAADGLGGGGDRERVLAIMKDSRVGAYGVMGLWLLLTLRFAVLGACAARPALQVVALFVLAAGWGRWTAAPLLRWLPALGDGLAKDIRSDGRALPGVVATAFALLATVGAWWVGLPHAFAAAGVAVAVTALWGLYLRWRLGGQSGDLLGAGNQLVEAGVLLAVIAT